MSNYELRNPKSDKKNFEEVFSQFLLSHLEDNMT